MTGYRRQVSLVLHIYIYIRRSSSLILALQFLIKLIIYIIYQDIVPSVHNRSCMHDLHLASSVQQIYKNS